MQAANSYEVQEPHREFNDEFELYSHIATQLYNQGIF
jgi:hypothetical protein